MRKFKFEQKGHFGILKFCGTLTIQQVQDMKAALMRALANADHLIFDFEKVTRMDISCFKLFCVAHRIALNLNKQLTLVGLRQTPLKQLLEDIVRYPASTAI